MKKIVALVLSLVMVLGLATTAMAATTTPAVFDLHQADATGKEILADVAYTLNDAVVNADGSGKVAWYTITPTVGVNRYFVEIPVADATTADFYLTKANEKTPLVYLAEIQAGENAYTYVVEEFAGFGLKCGEMNVPYTYTVAELGFYAYTNPVTGLKTYFVEKDSTFTYTSGAPYFNGASVAVTATPVLVDGAIVEAYQIGNVGGGALVLNQHAWSPVAYDKTTPVKAMCGLCGTEAVVYKDGKAPAGSLVIDQKFNNVDYDLVITAATSAPVVDGEKVESAETFDAGIAMYVGMSVMAAAGSAVVLKKD